MSSIGIFLTALLNVSFAMSAVILLLLLLNKLTANRIPAMFRYYAWLIILIGLLIPFRPDIPIPFKLVPIPAALNISGTAEKRIQNEAQQISPLASSAISDRATVPTTIAAKRSVFHIFVLFGIWITGTLTVLAFHLRAYLKFASAIRRWSTKEKDGRILSILRTAQDDMGLKNKPIAIKTCMLISSPMLIGFRRPAILLPEKTISPDELDYIFRHELTHYRRGDLWMNLLVLLVSAMHWFNPFVYLMAKTIRTECEAACDETVVAGNNTDKRKYYGETIIGFVGEKNRTIPVLSTYFYGGTNSMKKRLFSIMDTSRKSKWLAAVYTMAVVAVTVLSGNVVAAQSVSAPAIPGAPYYHAQASITAESAQKTALARVGGGTVVRVETKYPKHGMEYKVLIVYGDYKYNVHVSAYDGSIINMKMDQITKIGAGAYNNTAEVIDTESAKSIAVKSAGGGIVTECKLEHKKREGVMVYHIHVANGHYEYCVELVAATGTVYKVEPKYKPSIL